MEALALAALLVLEMWNVVRSNYPATPVWQTVLFDLTLCYLWITVVRVLFGL